MGSIEGLSTKPTAQQAIQFCAAKGGAGGRGLECAVREVISAEVERGVDRKHRGHVVAKGKRENSKL